MDRALQVPGCTSAAADSVSFLQRWLCSSSGWGSRVSQQGVPEQQGVPVAVIGLHRYLAPPPHSRPTPQHHQCDSASHSTKPLLHQGDSASHSTKPLLHQGDSASHSSSSYDMTVTDGACRTKLLLHPSLHLLIQRGSLRCGVEVVLTGWSFIHHESRLGRGGYVCVTGLSIRSEEEEEVCSLLANLTDLDTLPLVAARGDGTLETLTTTGPLQLNRHHYLPLWNDVDPQGSVWRGPLQGPPSTVLLDVSRIMLLSDLESCSGSQCKLPPLLVRILHKSRLRYYGKPGHKIPYPYQAYLEVSDQSGIMSAVLWNELCPEWYGRLSVGTVLYLQGYKLKPSYNQRSRPHLDHHGLKVYTSVEIGLNASTPAASITVVPARCVPAQWSLPQVCYQFTSRSEVSSMASGSVCDVIALVTFVSRVERLKESSKTTDQVSDKFWTYRWVHAIDGSSSHPFILQIFSTSHPEVFNNICPMTYLVCTQMRVCQVIGSLPYLTSSCETEIFITGGHRGQPYVADPRVKTFLQWTKTLKDHVTMRHCSVGGQYCYPPPPPSYTQPGEDETPVSIPLLAAADLYTELQSLQYREHRRLALQGHIVEVTYRTCPQGPETRLQTCPQGPEPRQSPKTRTTNQKPVSEEGSPGRSGDHHAPEDPPTPGDPPTRSALENTRKRKLQDSTEETTPPHTEETTPPPPPHTPPPPPHDLQLDPTVSRWVNPSWPEQRARLSWRCGGGLFRDSLTHSFHYDHKDPLLHWANLHPDHWTPRDHWTPGQTPHTVHCPGYYQLTILGLNRDVSFEAAFLPFRGSEDPRAVGVVQDPHRDPQGSSTLLSCLSSGFLCPARDHPGTPPHPEDLVATAEDLKETPVVVVLDACLLDADRLELMVSRVYTLSAGC